MAIALQKPFLCYDKSKTISMQTGATSRGHGGWLLQEWNYSRGLWWLAPTRMEFNFLLKSLWTEAGYVNIEEGTTGNGVCMHNIPYIPPINRTFMVASNHKSLEMITAKNPHLGTIQAYSECFSVGIHMALISNKGQK